MRLISDIVPVHDVTPQERRRMFALMRRCYENVERRQFDRDLDRKRVVIHVRDPASDELVGFSTQTILQCCVNGKTVRALYSGDTVMDPAYWGDAALANAWGRLALETVDDCGSDGPLYWFLTSKGFRTYRYLPLFFKRYSPCRETATAASSSAVLDAFGELVGGAAYDPRTGVISAPQTAYVVCDSVADPGRREQSDPHVRYFIERNPGHERGDELCCLAPLSRENFTRAAYRVINAPAKCREK
jgi:hypothetical protein